LLRRHRRHLRAPVAEDDELVYERRRASMRRARHERAGQNDGGHEQDTTHGTRTSYFLAFLTWTTSAFERTDCGAVAFSTARPTPLNDVLATPWAFVLSTPTLAPATGLPSWPSTTLTLNFFPDTARAGPVSLRTCFMENRS